VISISSRQNRHYKRWLRVARAAGGARSDAVLLEGIHLCSAWLQHYGAPEAILLDETQLSQHALQEFMSSFEDDAPIYALSRQLFQGLSDVVTTQGVMFLVARPKAQPMTSINRTCVLLDRIQDPGNLGTILRTIAALDINEVYLTPGTVNAWSPKVLRSAQGAHFLTTIYEQVEFSKWLANLQIPLAITLLNEQSRSLYDADLQGPIAWAFGNESQGINPRWNEAATHQLIIPHAQQIESLNVSVAAAVCLFEHQRQNQQNANLDASSCADSNPPR